MARALDGAWAALGEPDPFVVVEAGAGRGRLAADVLRAAPACAATLRYVLVERSAALRAAQRELLTLEPRRRGARPVHVGRRRRASALEPVAGRGPIVTALDELPALRVDGVVLANELLDNLPVPSSSAPATAWLEVRVGARRRRPASSRSLVAGAAGARRRGRRGRRRRHGVRAARGSRCRTRSADWLERVRRVCCGAGDVVLVDYAADTATLARRAGQDAWLRTYRAHQRGGGDPSTRPATQDITCDVPLEYLVAVAERVGLPTSPSTRRQAEWLRRARHRGARRRGRRDAGGSGPTVGDLEAIAGRSRVHEAAALTDPGGLGAHRVVVLRRR